MTASSTENCTRCGTELKWNERRLVFWNKQLKKGYIKWYVMGSPLMGKEKKFPEYQGKKLCQICAYEVFTDEDYSAQRKSGHPPTGNLKTEGDQSSISDFPALRNFLKRNGVVMAAFNCPKCNNMVDIPETGKLLICKHCGNPIKPTEVYEKIKSVIS